jgi:hypothetical protein
MNRKRLTKEALYKLQHPKNLHIKYKLMEILNRTKVSINLTARKNEWNGDFTKDAVLDVLEAELRMSRAELLEVEPINPDEQ